ncbi:hypothetical protein SMC26_39110 [Actinomadura fulvescens]|uniref:hypothetical protein n=1 Tax=Actinomadura fulvescens TaxID=46160 RepID=UPI0031D8C540
MMRLAVEVVKVAYQEALVRHGMFPGTVALIDCYTQEHLAALDSDPESLPGDVIYQLLDAAEDLMDGSACRDLPEHSPP